MNDKELYKTLCDRQSAYGLCLNIITNIRLRHGTIEEAYREIDKKFNDVEERLAKMEEE